MSLQPQEIPPIPEETRRVAQAAFPRGNVYMRMRDELGTIYEDHLFAAAISGAWAASRVALAPRPHDRDAVCRGLVRPPGG